MLLWEVLPFLLLFIPCYNAGLGLFCITEQSRKKCQPLLSMAGIILSINK
ncbi:conserved hypothetical protein [Xenorhabdus nematophila F1]|nr:conserved hypothetical protein [Xenorhabdus nematophila F1]